MGKNIIPLITKIRNVTFVEKLLSNDNNNNEYFNNNEGYEENGRKNNFKFGH